LRRPSPRKAQIGRGRGRPPDCSLEPSHNRSTTRISPARRRRGRPAATGPRRPQALGPVGPECLLRG
jgi:hypothetical protein